MDQERQVRFLYPPFFFVMSLLFGLILDSSRSLKDIVPALKTSTSGPIEILGLLAGGSVFVLASGFLIGAISSLLLRFGFRVFGKRHYEASVTPSSLGRIWKMLDSLDGPSQDKILYAVATFDHELLSPGIREWIHRRWIAFTTSAHCCTALGLALILGACLSIALKWEWLVVSLLVFAVLAFNAFFAWRDAMSMLEFQSRRQTRYKS